MWHGAFHCMIAYPGKPGPEVLFQLRSRTKKIAPGKFDVSVGGHYSTGEGPEDAGPREIREELGLDVSFRSLVPLGRRIFVYCFGPGVREYEFQDVYLLPLERQPEGIYLQASEVEGVLAVNAEKGIELFLGFIPYLDGTLIRGGGERVMIRVRPDDFVPSLDRYYLKLLQLVDRYFRGDRQGLVI